MGVIFFITTVVFFIMWKKQKKKRAVETKAHDQYAADAESKISALAKYQKIIDAENAANKILDEAEEARFDAQRKAENIIFSAENDAKEIRTNAKEEAKSIREKANTARAKADATLSSAENEAASVIAAAKEKAALIAGEAYTIKENADFYRSTADAMRNVINGYGDEWLKPTYSLLDELADEFGYTDAGQKLKEARAHSARMVKDQLAAVCDYAEESRRKTAVDFVVDAFNGKVDSILTKYKKDNYGKLEQQIRDAYALVNYNGKAFRNARISEEYLDARIEELHWAVIVQELRAKELEEQREAKERIREEEKARRDFERAQKAAEKEEAMLKKAMEKAQEMLAKATEDQRVEYEAQLADLSTKLQEAEEKNKRAQSMAQQTKRGNVYVISNIGSFGENVYKVGMTRRLDPMDRVKELGDASVPFKFDVHAIIESEDAPALEHALHQELALMQVNKVNPKKEFFRVSLADIRKLVEKHGLNASWTMTAEAAEYRETLAIEAQMQNDPAVKEKWIAFAQSIADEESAVEEIA